MSNQQELTLEEKWAIVARHSQYVDINKGSVPRGTLKILESELNVPRKTIERVVTEYLKLCQVAQGFFVNLAPKKVGRVGAKSKLTDSKKRAIIRKNMVANRRAPIRTLTSKVRIAKSTLHRYL